MHDPSYYDGSTCERAKKPPVEKVLLYTGSYAPDHPYLHMTIDQLLDPDFVAANGSLLPACWQPFRE